MKMLFQQKIEVVLKALPELSVDGYKVIKTESLEYKFIISQCG